jgi:hypothetical protein
MSGSLRLVATIPAGRNVPSVEHPTLPNTIILPGVTAVSITLPDQLSLSNSQVEHNRIGWVRIGGELSVRAIQCRRGSGGSGAGELPDL